MQPALQALFSQAEHEAEEQATSDVEQGDNDEGDDVDLSQDIVGMSDDGEESEDEKENGAKGGSMQVRVSLSLSLSQQCNIEHSLTQLLLSFRFVLQVGDDFHPVLESDKCLTSQQWTQNRWLEGILAFPYEVQLILEGEKYVTADRSYPLIKTVRNAIATKTHFKAPKVSK